MRAISIRLINATPGMNLRDIEAKSGISMSTISKIKRGEAWPTMVAIAHLERTLHIRLWGDEHYIPPPPP